MNIYMDPERFGLKIMAEADFGSGWDYAKFVVWQDEDDTWFWAYSSGCSCSSPFDRAGLDSLTRIKDFADLVRCVSGYGDTDEGSVYERIRLKENCALNGLL